MSVGASPFNRLERITLTRTEDGYEALEHRNGQTFLFTHQGKDRVYRTYCLTSISDADQQTITFAYSNGHLSPITDAADSRIYAHSNMHCEEYIKNVY